jgi:mannose-1-phosphate guanylyltransferase
VTTRRDLLVVLGIEPRAPEVEYGWIEPVIDPGAAVTPIRRFWEKPSAPLAQALLGLGCLWNSFVMVGWADAFRDVIATAVPEIADAFAPLGTALGRPAEAKRLERAYASLPVIGFSERVLSPMAHRFSVMRVKDVGWCDLGNPRRVSESARRRGDDPPWHVGAA